MELSLSIFAMFIPALLLGLGSSFSHCAGMCGPIHMLILQNKNASVSFYHIGRIMGYMILGTLVASMGTSWEFVSNPLFKSITRGFIIGTYILLGLIFLISAQKLELIFSKIIPFPHSKLQVLLRGSPKKMFGAGLLASLLPCPMIISALGLALTSNHPMNGAFMLLIFGIATLPVFVILNRKILSPKLFSARGFQIILAIYFIGFGLFKIYAWMTEPAMANCHCH
jgi:sulfite exporter TauE/SafE